MILGVGSTCVWYPHAESKQTPVACVVTGVKRDGVLTLARFPKHGGTVTQVDNCRHIDDPFLRENPQMRILYGAWDTVESGHKRSMGEVDIAPNAKTEVVEETETVEETPEDKVFALFDEGLSLEDIAEKMGRGWGEKKVSATLKERQTA